VRLHHVGIAVLDLDESIEMYASLLGGAVTHRTKSEQEGLEAALLRLGDVELELMAATREDSPVGKFLARRGPGVHHLAYAVGDIEAKLAEMREAGYELIDAVPRVGIHGVRIAFVHPKSVGGVLTELVEA
jgi:methylmalonyl-CoA/ethylmalonyl-CoA epimerase